MHGKHGEYSTRVYDVIAIRAMECLSDGELICPWAWAQSLWVFRRQCGAQRAALRRI